MCYFITVGIPRRQRAAADAFVHAGLAIQRTGNPHFARLFGEGFVALEVTNGMCSCDLYAERETRDTREQDRRRYEKKGWSKAKILRALEAKNERFRARPAFEQFVRAVTDIVTQTGAMLLFAHVYSGRIDTEAFGEVACVDQSLAHFTGAFPRDTVVQLQSKVA